MRTPDRVKQDTEKHRQAVGTVGKFLADRCEVGVFEPDVAATAQGLHRAYVKWDREQPAPEKLPAAQFALEMARLGHESTKAMGVSRNVAYRYLTVRVLPEALEDERVF
jgi:hypothetical protein